MAQNLGDIAAIAAAVDARCGAADVLLCPPATLITRAATAAAGRVSIGAQDRACETSGAFTGDVSADMMKDAGATAVIVGHSERRQRHGETDAMVAAKALAAWRAGLMTINCIGETHAQRRAGHAFEVCGAQVAGSVPDNLAALKSSIAYETLWAIGTGQVPGALEIQEMLAHIRQCLLAHWGDEARRIRILYGGSVTATNARAVLAIPEVGGALVGGASLKATGFDAILRAVPTDG